MQMHKKPLRMHNLSVLRGILLENGYFLFHRRIGTKSSRQTPDLMSNMSVTQIPWSTDALKIAFAVVNKHWPTIMNMIDAQDNVVIILPSFSDKNELFKELEEAAPRVNLVNGIESPFENNELSSPLKSIAETSLSFSFKS